MAKKRKKQRVYIIHNKKRGRWRVLTVSAAGKRHYENVASQREAECLKSALLKAGEYQPTFDESISKFVADIKEAVSERSLTTKEHRLRALFDSVIDDAACYLTRQDAQKLYDKYRKAPTKKGKPPAAATHHNTVDEAKRFFDWMLKKKLASINPFDKIEKHGKKNKGKKQLTDEEASIFASAVLPLAQAGDLGALASLICLVFGLRAGEVAGIKPEDITVYSVYIRRSGQGTETTKTEAGQRRLRIPPMLLNLTNAAKASCRGVFLFGDRHWVARNVKRLCKFAGVPPVCAQGLRGTAASLALESGQIGAAVIHSLGHTSFDTTKAHYLAPGAVETANAKSVADFLVGSQKIIPNLIPSRKEENPQGVPPVGKGAQDVDS